MEPTMPRTLNAHFDPHPTNPDLVRIFAPCVECNRPHVFDMPEADFFSGLSSLRSGSLIQRAFPNLKPDNREALISNICPRCFDAITHD